ncbi:serine/threonine-protein kinase [Psychromicrobium xiongbiense]|uniref:serine/threonine-protein kinase n=1 Tax=Psychromicrobium xiongbiense TaxID=3051184 RepID=UPI0025534FCE|nr:serine/threonine-protein kinase [Psychromicrobium sp. YIM S02556]
MDFPASAQPLHHRYRLGDRLGAGACASVYRAEDLTLGRSVAVKIFGTGQNSYLSELSILARLQHPFLVTLLDGGHWDFGLDGVRAFLVMEYLPRGDLRGLIHQAPTGMSATRVARLGWALSQGLAAVHAAEVVHRDVKPANILIGADGLPQLCDFGISRAHDAAEATVPGQTIGTASYLSPEQALGEAVHASADIYSLGLVLLECLTGARSFPGSALEASLARLFHDPAIPESVEPAWKQLVRAMTARNPADRPGATECIGLLSELQLRQPAHVA